MTFGPWAKDIDDCERIARLRAMRALAFAWAHSCSQLITELKAAETDERALPRALKQLDVVPAIRRRKLLALYGAVHSPERPRRGIRGNK